MSEARSEQALKTVEEVGEATTAGTGCQGGQEDIQEISPSLPALHGNGHTCEALLRILRQSSREFPLELGN